MKKYKTLLVVVILYCITSCVPEQENILATQIFNFKEIPSNCIADNETLYKIIIELKNNNKPLDGLSVEKQKINLTTNFGQFDNGEEKISIDIDSNKTFVAFVKSAKSGVARIEAKLNDKYLISTNIIFSNPVPTALIKSIDIIGGDSLTADNYTTMLIKLKTNTIEQSSREFSIDLGSFADGSKTNNILPDMLGNYNLNIKSDQIGYGNLKVKINNINYLIKTIKYYESLPDKILLEISDNTSSIIYEPFKPIKITATLQKSNLGIVNIKRDLGLTFSADTNTTEAYGKFINNSVSDSYSKYHIEFYLKDTSYTGFINFKAIVNNNGLNLTEQKTTYFKYK